MEVAHPKTGATRAASNDLRCLVGQYLAAKSHVIRCGFSAEIEWQDTRGLTDFDESEFLKQAAWVVLSTGLREQVIRKHWPALSRAFVSWESASSIIRSESCGRSALSVIGNVRKIDAIIEIARIVDQQGFASVRSQVEECGVEYLKTFPFIGPVTAFHLAKNLGLDVVKPDRHLDRLTKALGLASAAVLCRRIADEIGDRIAVVDIVIWRFANLNGAGYIDHFVLGRE